MPVVLSPNKLYAKNQAGTDYLTANVISDQTTEEQCARIQSKADEVTAQLANASEVENMFAGAFNTTTNYVTGQYVIQTITSGSSSVNKLFRFTADHAAGAWIGTDAVEVKICNDVSDLKSALDQITESQTVDYTNVDMSIYSISGAGKWAKATGDSQNRSQTIEIPAGTQLINVAGSANNGSIIAILNTNNREVGEVADFATGYTGRISVYQGEEKTFALPSDAHYLYALAIDSSGVSRIPTVKLITMKTDETLTETKVPADAAVAGGKIRNSEKLGDLYIADIPGDYRQVLCLKSSGTQRVTITGLTIDSDNRVICDFGVESYPESGYSYLFGNRSSSSSKRFDFGVGTNGEVVAGYNNTYYIGSPLDKKRHTVDFNKNNVYIDNELIKTFENNTFTGPDISASFFCSHSAQGTTWYYGKFRIYSVKIYEDGTLIKNMIPCQRVSDSAYGFYDLVGSTFFEQGGDNPLVSTDMGLLDNAEAIDKTNELINEFQKVKEYIIQESDAVSDRVRNVQTGTSLTFAAVSDMHYNVDDNESNVALYDMGDAVKEIAGQTHLDFYASFGDIIFRLATGGNGNFEKGKQEAIAMTKILSDCFGNNDQIRMVGNHDPNCEAATGYFTAEQMYSFTGIYDNMLVKNPAVPYGGYGYHDYEDRKIRLIVLNTSFYSKNASPTQLETKYEIGGSQAYWLCSALDLSEKADASSWQIFILSHVALDISGHKAVSARTDVIDAYVNGSTWSMSSYEYNFSGKNAARIAAMICGHSHKYDIANLNRMQNDVVTDTFDIPVLYVPNALPSRELESLDGVTYTKTPNTAESTSFQIITIDGENGIIYAHHYGAGIDFIVHHLPLTVTSSETVTTDLTSPTWNSTNTSASTVSNGTITAVDAGKAIIWAKSETDNCIECWNISVS